MGRNFDAHFDSILNILLDPVIPEAWNQLSLWLTIFLQILLSHLLIHRGNFEHWEVIHQSCLASVDVQNTKITDLDRIRGSPNGINVVNLRISEKMRIFIGSNLIVAKIWWINKITKRFTIFQTLTQWDVVQRFYSLNNVSLQKLLNGKWRLGGIHLKFVNVFFKNWFNQSQKWVCIFFITSKSISKKYDRPLSQKRADVQTQEVSGHKSSSAPPSQKQKNNLKNNSYMYFGLHRWLPGYRIHITKWWSFTSQFDEN